jgi:hypothetical protein
MTPSLSTPASRAQILRAGREAALVRRRADSQRCRDRVTTVIEQTRTHTIQ